ncbi:MAG: hypothetical protein NT062_34030 [Proteobacteria bacterium]|nr:hypothetical protein [Pseudomonadota bacterium]
MSQSKDRPAVPLEPITSFYRMINEDSGEPDPVLADDPAGFALFREQRVGTYISRLPGFRAAFDQPARSVDSLTEREIQNLESELRMAWHWEQRERADRAEQRDRAFSKQMPARAGADARTADVTRAAIIAIQAWGADPTKTIAVLSGGVGTGKTVTACWWALHAATVPTFVRATELATASRYGDERDKWYGARGLIVDDLGAEYLDPKGSLLVDLDELVDRFYADRRRLVITTNLMGKPFAERYGQRIADRLRQAGSWITVAGASLRNGKAGK